MAANNVVDPHHIGVALAPDRNKKMTRNETVLSGKENTSISGSGCGADSYR
jgi:hypothetical protein